MASTHQSAFHFIQLMTVQDGYQAAGSSNILFAKTKQKHQCQRQLIDKIIDYCVKAVDMKNQQTSRELNLCINN